MSEGITIIDVAKAMGVELTNEQAWGIGAAVRDAYREQHGELPPKHLRPKTKGVGSHCFAIYPESWVHRIRAAILTVEANREAQQSLF